MMTASKTVVHLWAAACEAREKGTQGFPIGIGGEAFEKIIELAEFIGIRFGGDNVRMHMKQ
jgi:hypothetical protein